MIYRNHMFLAGVLVLMGAWPSSAQSPPPPGAGAGQAAPGKRHVVPLGHPSTGAMLTEDSRHLVIAHQKANLLSIYDVEAGKVVATVNSQSPGVMCSRQDLVFVANEGRGTIGVHSVKAGWKLSGELAVPHKHIGRIDALRGARYDGRLLVCCADEPRRAVVLVDVQRDEFKSLDKSNFVPHDAVLDFSGTFVLTSHGLYHADDFLAGKMRKLAGGSSYIGEALPGGLWASGGCIYDPGADLLYRPYRGGNPSVASGPVLKVMNRDNLFKPVATVDLTVYTDMEHVRPMAVTLGGTLHLLWLKADHTKGGVLWVLTDLQLPAVKRPEPGTQPALPALARTPAVRPLRSPDCQLFDAADGKNVMLLQDVQLTWLNASDLTTTRSLTLGRLYAKVYERQDYLVAQGDGSVDLLDAQTAKLLKRIKLNEQFTLDMACSPEGNSTYVTMLEKRDGPIPNSRFGVIYHVDEKTGVVTDTKAPGWQMAFTSEGILVTWGKQDFRFDGNWSNWSFSRQVRSDTINPMSVRSYVARGPRLMLKTAPDLDCRFVPGSAVSALRTGILLETRWDKQAKEHFFCLLSADLSASTPTRVPRTPVTAAYGRLLVEIDVKDGVRSGPKLVDLDTGRDITARLVRAGVLFKSLREVRFSPDGKYLLGVNTSSYEWHAVLEDQPTLLSMPVLGEGENP